MKKKILVILNTVILLVLASLHILAGVVIYWAFIDGSKPSATYEVESLKKEYKVGEPIVLVYKYHIQTDCKFGKLTHFLSGLNREYSMPVNSITKGNEILEIRTPKPRRGQVETELPFMLDAGDWKYQSKIQYYCNPLKSKTIDTNTITIKVD